MQRLLQSLFFSFAVVLFLPIAAHANDAGWKVIERSAWCDCQRHCRHAKNIQHSNHWRRGDYFNRC